MDDPLKELSTAYDRLCQRVKPCENAYTFLTERRDDGSPHVEFTKGEYHYVVTERGLELERKSTADFREILYWLLYDMTFWMGVAHEFKNRVESKDCRRMIFAHQFELMKKTDSAFAGRLELDIADTLSRNPYKDQT